MPEMRNCRSKKSAIRKTWLYVKFSGSDDRNRAEALKDRFLTIDRENLRELDEDEYFIFDLIGLVAVDQEGRRLGTVSAT